MNTSTFNQQLRMSQGVSESKSIQDILVANLPGAVSAYQSTKTEDLSGVDWWVKMVSGHSVGVDCKVRSVDWAAKNPSEDDLALETWSIVETRIVGWTRNIHKRTDYILWLFVDTGRWCLIPFLQLCAVFTDEWREWRKKYKTRVQETTTAKTYHSECVFVPRTIVWREIYNRYGGSTASPL